jgi:uncharacterized membrane protein
MQYCFVYNFPTETFCITLPTYTELRQKFQNNGVIVFKHVLITFAILNKFCDIFGYQIKALFRVNKHSWRRIIKNLVYGFKQLQLCDKCETRDNFMFDLRKIAACLSIS